MSLLLCDLDDTLVDRDEAFRIWATRFTELHSLPAPQTVSWLIELDGHGYTSRSELVAAIIERHGIWSDPAIAIREFRDELVSCLPSVSSQVAAELSRLREAGWRVGIVTNGEIKQQENKVKASGLDRLVDAVVVSDAVGCRKPDPAIFQNAAERCSAGLEGGWMIGDNPEADIGGAAAVGLKTIWLRRGRRWDVPGIRPVVQVDSLLDGLSYLARLPQMEAAPEPQVQVTESPPDEILTARLRLLPLSPADLDELAQMYADPEVMLGSSGVPVARSREESVEWLTRTLVSQTADFHHTFRVEHRADGKFLGRCGLRPDSEAPETELAFAFARAAWGRGIATEAARAILEWGIANGLQRVVSCALANNGRSQRVLEKVGMLRTGERPTAYGPLVLFEMDLGES